MALKLHKPTTPGRRGFVQLDLGDLYKGKPHKGLVRGLSGSGGRNNAGRITARRIGGGHKRKYRLIDFKRRKFDISATVQHIEYDPNRSAFIALLRYDDGEYAYIIAPQGLQEGNTVISSQEIVDIRVGNAMPLAKMPVGTVIHNVEMKPGKGGQMARSAGCSVLLAGKDRDYAQLKLSSGELRLIPKASMATVGVVSNPDQKNVKLGKAGRKRWLGKRPEVRGVAMNPIDHPHGGGEGKTSGGRHPVTPWGKPTKGKKTRSNKVTGKYIIRRRVKRRRG